MSATTTDNKAFTEAAAQNLLDVGFSGIGALCVANNISSLQPSRPNIFELRESLTMFLESGLEGSDIELMLVACPQLAKRDQADIAIETLTVLQNTFELRRYDFRRIARNEPLILLKPDLSDTIQALDEIGLSGKNLKLTILRWPKILRYSRNAVLSLRNFLAHPVVGFQESQVGSLVRQAPWLLDGDIEKQMGPVVRFLAKLQIRRIETVIRAYPQVLLTDVATELLPRVQFLMKDLGLSFADMSSVIAAFPLVLGLDVETRMRPAVLYLTNERLEIKQESIVKIFRAFPSLLGLDTQIHYDASIAFLEEIGVDNIGRFVLRLPPVLGYDVETNLRPKWDYLKNSLELSTYDVTRFPAYFSYPLEKVIIPRTRYLSERCNKKTSIWGLNTILTPSDESFAIKVAMTSAEEYDVYKRAVIKQLERSKKEVAANENQEQVKPNEVVSSVPWLQQESKATDPTLTNDDVTAFNYFARPTNNSKAMSSEPLVGSATESYLGYLGSNTSSRVFLTPALDS